MIKNVLFIAMGYVRHVIVIASQRQSRVGHGVAIVRFVNPLSGLRAAVYDDWRNSQRG